MKKQTSRTLVIALVAIMLGNLALGFLVLTDLNIWMSRGISIIVCAAVALAIELLWKKGEA